MGAVGQLGFRDFDLGCFLHLGGQLESYAIDGGTRQAYAVAVSGSAGTPHLNGKVPIFFKAPEERHQEYILPCYAFIRSSFEPAFDRRPWYGVTRREPAPGASPVSVPAGYTGGVQTVLEGYDAYVHQWQALPFNISYDLQIKGRTQSEFLAMLFYALRRFMPPWFRLLVTDSLGVSRGYDTGEISVSDTSELADIQNREISATLSFVVQAEIDLVDTWSEGAVTSLPQFQYDKI